MRIGVKKGARANSTQCPRHSHMLRSKVVMSNAITALVVTIERRGDVKTQMKVMVGAQVRAVW